MSKISQEESLSYDVDNVDNVANGSIAISSSDGVVHSESSSFGRRLDVLRENNSNTGSCTHTGWDS